VALRGHPSAQGLMPNSNGLGLGDELFGSSRCGVHKWGSAGGADEKKHRLESWGTCMIPGRLFGLIGGALALVGCATIQETALAPNMVRLDVEPYAAPFVGEATMRRAAELTLQNGYSAFRLMPIYVHAFDEFGVTVVMFHIGDRSAYGAFNAEAALQKYGG
jgi:hypothetical protein